MRSAPIVVVWLGVVLTACGGTTGPPTGPSDGGGPFADDRPATRAAFQAARQRWIGAGIASYQYSYRRTCFCTPAATAPVRITVRGGRVAAVVLADSGEPVPPTGYPTIDELFLTLQQALDSGAYEIRATYDVARGYPTSLYIDRDPGVADEEMRIDASDLQPLP